MARLGYMGLTLKESSDVFNSSEYDKDLLKLELQKPNLESIKLIINRDNTL